MIVIFDLDGTLLDTLEDISYLVNNTLKHFNLPLVTIDFIRQHLGYGSKFLINSVLPSDIKDKDSLYAYYLKEYSAWDNRFTKPYPNIIECLKTLKSLGCITCIASNKPENIVLEIKDKMFNNLIDYAVGDIPTAKTKPAPDMINRLLSIIPNQKGSKKLYIGDTEVDYETAKNSNLDFIAVSWGFRSKEQLIKSVSKDTKILDTPLELLSALKELSK
jgi:phosphoglycolate phosphatase